MKYERIVELTKTVTDLHSSELEALGKVWLQEKKNLENSGEYREFIKKMQREWAIETGIIEHLYTWDRGITEMLIEQGVDEAIIYSSGQVADRDRARGISNLIKDQESVIVGLFDVIKEERPFSQNFIKTLHAKFTEHQDSTQAITPDGRSFQIPLLKGEYKQQPNNPRRSDGSKHEYCPPELVIDEMEQLMQWYAQYNRDSMPPEILAAWFHHRFTQIHPFQDGNGRVARTLATFVFLKSGLFPLVIRSSDRETYISALEEADQGNLASLVNFFVTRQRASILSALGIQKQVEQGKHVQEIITSAVNLLKAKYSAQKAQIQSVYKVAQTLKAITAQQLKELEDKINPELQAIAIHGKQNFFAGMSQSLEEQDGHFFYRQIVEMAKKHDYYAVTGGHYRTWVRLILNTEKRFEIVFSIHGYSYDDNGVMVVSGFTFEKNFSDLQRNEDANSDYMDNEPFNTKPTNDIFQFNYLEDEDRIVKRYKEWLEESITIALAQWQQMLK